MADSPSVIRSSPDTLTVTASLSAMTALAVPRPAMDTCGAALPLAPARRTENLSAASGARSSTTGTEMVVVALSGDPAGKVTAPPRATKSLFNSAVPPAVVPQLTERGTVIPRLSVTVNTAFSPSSTSPGGPVMETTARSLSDRVRYTGSTRSHGLLLT